VSREYHLVTRDRPSTRAFIHTLTEATGHNIDIAGNLEDPDDYLNITSHDLLIEVQPPGHVEATDLNDIDQNVTLPQPDDEGCLWHTAANIPASAPPISADIIWQTFTRLAQAHHGAAIDPQTIRGSSSVSHPGTDGQKDTR
jgi:hypothetical protein